MRREKKAKDRKNKDLLVVSQIQVDKLALENLVGIFRQPVGYIQSVSNFTAHNQKLPLLDYSFNAST